MPGAIKECHLVLLQYMPDVIKGEFVNIGVLLFGPDGFADVRFTRDWARAKCLHPDIDIPTFESIEEQMRRDLQSGGGPEAVLKKISDSASGLLHLSDPKACLTDSPQDEIALLSRQYLDRPAAHAERGATGRQRIVNQMREAFEAAGVWKLMRKRIPVAGYTYKGDPLKIDCAYRPNGILKMYHAVALSTDVDAAKVLAFSYPQIAEGLARAENLKTRLTAIVEDDLDRSDEPIAFALETFSRADIAVVATADLPSVAELARRDLKL